MKGKLQERESLGKNGRAEEKGRMTRRVEGKKRRRKSSAKEWRRGGINGTNGRMKRIKK